MTSTTDPERDDRDDRWAGLTRTAPWIGGVVLLGGAVIMAVRVGVPAAVLWFGFAALAGAVLLFWEALRSVVDPEATAGDADQAALAGEMADLEARKRGAVKALKDLEFEHSIGRMSDEDYNALRDKYRAEARSAMEAIDRGLGAYLDEAKKLVADAVKSVESAPAAKSDDSAAKDPTAMPAESSAAKSSETKSESTKPGTASSRAASVESSATKTESTGATSTTESTVAVGARRDLPESADAKSEMPAVSASSPAVATTDASASRTCPSCGTRNDADATFCKRCAARLEETAS